VVQNEWAFYPLYPMLVRGLMALTGLSYALCAWAVSITCGAAAAVSLFRLVRGSMGRFGAGAMVACLFAWVAAPIFQVGYTESLALLLIALGLAALKGRRYGCFTLVAFALSLTRPITAALGLAALMVAAFRWRDARRGGPSFPLTEGIRAVVSAAGAIALMGLWPLLAGVATGRLDAYFATQAAWPVNEHASGLLAGWLPEILQLSGLGPLVLLGAVFVGFAVTRQGAAAWGRSLRVWVIFYFAFLLIATRPSPSLLRYSVLMIAPFWPLPDSERFPRTNVSSATRWLSLTTFIGFGLVCQYFWVTHVFTIQFSPESQPYP
jgi:hypothetical protein